MFFTLTIVPSWLESLTGNNAKTESVNNDDQTIFQHFDDDDVVVFERTNLPKNEPNPIATLVSFAGKALSIVGNKIQQVLEEHYAGKKALAKSQPGLLPWIGCPNEDVIKEECLSLSYNRRNFVHNPPEGIEFNFDYEAALPVALALLEYDPNLRLMRYQLVPKIINEESFWKNYFYRIELIRQAREFLANSSKETDFHQSQEISEPESVESLDELIYDEVDE